MSPRGSSRPPGQPQFLVKLQAGPGQEAGDKTWVRRSQLRATAAPWEEELAAAAEFQLARPQASPAPPSQHRGEPAELPGQITHYYSWI